MSLIFAGIVLLASLPDSNGHDSPISSQISLPLFMLTANANQNELIRAFVDFTELIPKSDKNGVLNEITCNGID